MPNHLPLSETSASVAAEAGPSRPRCCFPIQGLTQFELVHFGQAPESNRIRASRVPNADASSPLPRRRPTVIGTPDTVIAMSSEGITAAPQPFA